MQTNSTTTADPTPKSFYSVDSKGRLYLHKLVKLIYWIDAKSNRQTAPRFTIYRCLPNGSILPRVRMSKKDRRKLKLSLKEEPLPCSTPSSSPSSSGSFAPLPSTSPA